MYYPIYTKSYNPIILKSVIITLFQFGAVMAIPIVKNKEI